MGGALIFHINWKHSAIAQSKYSFYHFENINITKSIVVIKELFCYCDQFVIHWVDCT